MSTEEHDPQPAAESNPPRDTQDFILQLDFVPTWARKPADNPYGSDHAPAFREERFDRGDRRDRRDGERRGMGGRSGGGGGGPGKGPGGRRPPAPGGRAGAPARGGPQRDSREGRDNREARGPQERRSFGPPRVQLPLELSFIPERQQLSAAVRQLHASQKAYPLAYLAGLFLNRTEGHLIKLEVRPGRDGQHEMKLFQCTRDGALFMDAEALKSHAITHHLAEFFDEQEVDVEAPTGQFNCVGRCRLSGQLLGPPNYHGYQERLMDLYRSRFAHMQIDEYRNQVEMVRDPAVVEQWKEGCRRQKVYRVKGQPESAALKREEVIALFVQQHLPGLQKAGSRFMLPATAVKLMEAGPLRRQVEDAWARENRFPLSLMLALRPAFKRMRLHLFKVGRGETFVTAIVPKPLDSAHAVDELRAMLDLIRAHPGWSRASLLDHLQPGLPHDGEEAGRLLSPLRWLIEKGHVIEFFNGTLSAPSVPSARPPAAAPVATPAPEIVPSEPAPVAAETPVEPAPEAPPAQ